MEKVSRILKDKRSFNFLMDCCSKRGCQKDKHPYSASRYRCAVSGNGDSARGEARLIIKSHQSWDLSCSGQYREESTLKILVHLIDRLIHRPGEMLVELGPGDGKRFWYRTFSVEKYEVAECILGVIAALFRIVLQQNLYAQCVFKHRTTFACVV